MRTKEYWEIYYEKPKVKESIEFFFLIQDNTRDKEWDGEALEQCG